MQPKEAYTVKELTMLFNISRQALAKHIERLDSSFKAKNDKGHTVILLSGVKILALKFENKKLPVWLRVGTSNTHTNADLTGDSGVASELREGLPQQRKSSVNDSENSEVTSRLSNRLHEGVSNTHTNADLTGDSGVASGLRKGLPQQQKSSVNDSENSEVTSRLLEQLNIKDEQIKKLHDLLDQQQRLQLKTQQLLEEKTKLLDIAQQKKWWQFWK